MPDDNAPVTFFYEHAGWSYDPRTETSEEGRMRCALALADAEARLKAGRYCVSHELDPEPWDGDMPYDGPLWVVKLWSCDDRAVLGSVGSVACEEDSPYLRVVAAELAAECITP